MLSADSGVGDGVPSAAIECWARATSLLCQDSVLPMSGLSIWKQSACCQSVLSGPDGENPWGSHFPLENCQCLNVLQNHISLLGSKKRRSSMRGCNLSFFISRIGQVFHFRLTLPSPLKEKKKKGCKAFCTTQSSSFEKKK